MEPNVVEPRDCVHPDIFMERPERTKYVRVWSHEGEAKPHNFNMLAMALNSLAAQPAFAQWFWRWLRQEAVSTTHIKKRVGSTSPDIEPPQGWSRLTCEWERARRSCLLECSPIDGDAMFLDRSQLELNLKFVFDVISVVKS